MQQTVVDTFKSFLHLHADYYESLPGSRGHANDDWVKIISVCVKPGTCKTFAVTDFNCR